MELESGFRLLRVGETIRKSDEYSDNGGSSWNGVLFAGLSVEPDDYPIRRKIKDADCTGEQLMKTSDINDEEIEALYEKTDHVPEGFQLVSELAISYLFDNYREAYKGFYELIDRHPEQTIDEWVDGLPPVGTYCKARWLLPPDGGCPDWVKGTFRGRFGDMVWFGCDEEVVIFKNQIEFRPIETEQQKEVDELIHVVSIALLRHDQDVTELCNRSLDYFKGPATTVINSLMDSYKLVKKDTDHE